MEIAPLDPGHGREDFDCGVPALNEFLKRYAGQNERAGLSRTYVATEEGATAVLGFVTICAGRIECGALPDADRRRVPRYPVPVVQLARLAVDRGARGAGLGAQLLVFALDKAIDVGEELGVWGVEVVAKDGGARSFYARYGFESLVDDALHLYIPLRVVLKMRDS